MLTPFHLAVQVRDIEEAREFYGVKLGFPEGRSSDRWVDFDMFGHQFVVHLNTKLGPTGTIEQICNMVDGHGIPVPHFGVVLSFDEWDDLVDRVRGVISDFVVEPYVRFQGEPGEQRTMFFRDPSGNALEFKAFASIETSLFAK